MGSYYESASDHILYSLTNAGFSFFLAKDKFFFLFFFLNCDTDTENLIQHLYLLIRAVFAVTGFCYLRAGSVQFSVPSVLLTLRFEIEQSMIGTASLRFPYSFTLCVLSSIMTVPLQHGHKLGLCGPKILNDLQTLRVILEEACVQQFNPIKVMRAKRNKISIKLVNVEVCFISQVWLLQRTKLQCSIDLTEPLLQ